MLVRRGLPLALATVELDDGAALVDLGDPAISSLMSCGRRVSRPATAT
jgi:hypothetical protein